MKDAKLKGSVRFIFRHIDRAKLKSLLVAIVSVFFVLALSFLHESIERAADELDHIYETTIVNAEIAMRADPTDLLPRARRFGDVIRPITRDRVLDSGFSQSEHFVAFYRYAFLTPMPKNGILPTDWHSFWSDPLAEGYTLSDAHVNALVAISDLELFVREHRRDTIDEMTLDWAFEHRVDGYLDLDRAVQIGMEELEIEFADGFDESNFVFTQGEPVPVIISAHIADFHGLSLGDVAHISVCEPMDWIRLFTRDMISDAVPMRTWIHRHAVIIGMHNSSANMDIGHGIIRNAFLMPIEAAEDIFARPLLHELGFTTFNFEINPAYNRDLFVVRDYLQDIVNHRDAGWVSLGLHLHDEELRVVVGSMEQNLSLLRLLYPIAIAVSVIIGAGLSLLLMLQNAKNAAIMRVLGSTKSRTRAVLWIEQFIVCLVGLIIGLAAAFILGWGASASVMLAGLYLAGVVIGSVVGSVLVTSKPPLELLQVKE